MTKNPPAITGYARDSVSVSQLGRSLEKGMATPIFLPEKFYGQKSLAGYRPWAKQGVEHDWATEHAEKHKSKKGPKRV